MARHFHAANPDSILIGTGIIASPLQGLLVMCWVNLDDTASEHKCMSRWDGTINEQWLLTVAPGGVPTFDVLDNAFTGHGASSSVSIGSGAWHHLAGLYDGTTVYIMVDGVVTGTTTSPSLNGNATVAVRIGQDGQGNAPMNGSLAECSIILVNTSLTPSAGYQRTATANAQGAAATELDGMYNTLNMGYWPLHGDSPEPDYSQGVHPGTVTGTTVVSHPPVASILSFGRSRENASGTGLA